MKVWGTMIHNYTCKFHNLLHGYAVHGLTLVISDIREHCSNRKVNADRAKMNFAFTSYDVYSKLLIYLYCNWKFRVTKNAPLYIKKRTKNC